MAQLELYVPHKRIKWEDRFGIRDMACGLFGGLTEYPAFGMWSDPKSGHISGERVSVMRVITSAKRRKCLVAFGCAAAKMVKKELSQKCVLYTIDGEPYYE